ncbi:hypothetical protein IH785_15885 [candidate division KSB1 bacterium]|nr:hypothetical protein [candidate division KSB1 bacterium]
MPLTWTSSPAPPTAQGTNPTKSTEVVRLTVEVVAFARLVGTAVVLSDNAVGAF